MKYNISVKLKNSNIIYLEEVEAMDAKQACNIAEKIVKEKNNLDCELVTRVIESGNL